MTTPPQSAQHGLTRDDPSFFFFLFFPFFPPFFFPTAKCAAQGWPGTQDGHTNQKQRQESNVVAIFAAQSLIISAANMCQFFAPASYRIEPPHEDVLMSPLSARARCGE